MNYIEKSSTIYKKALYLQQIGEPFTLKRINNKFRLTSEYFGDSSSQANRKIPSKELGFIRRVRNYIMKNEVYANFIDNLYYPSDIKYVDVSRKKPNSEFLDCVEIDIDEAYWKTAYSLGVISKSLYREGSKENGKISKLCRLISLGSLAKKEYSYFFNGKQLRKTTERSVLTENIWYSICKRISDVMHEAKLIAGENFLLYWVDGIYVKNDPIVIEKIMDCFSSYGYEVKTIRGLHVLYDSEKVIVESTSENSNELSKRPFFISKKHPPVSYFTDEQLRDTALKYSQYGVMDDIDDSQILNQFNDEN